MEPWRSSSFTACAMTLNSSKSCNFMFGDWKLASQPCSSIDERAHTSCIGLDTRASKHLPLPMLLFRRNVRRTRSFSRVPFSGVHWLSVRSSPNHSITCAPSIEDQLSAKGGTCSSWTLNKVSVKDRSNKALTRGRSIGLIDSRGPLLRHVERRCAGPVRSLPVGALVELVASSSAVATTTSGPHIVTTVTQVAVTAAAVVYGAYLSDEMLRGNKEMERPRPFVCEGVDVTDYPIFRETEVLKAIAFAADAHFGQTRKTGDAYVTHCIHTGRILAALVPAQGKRAVETVVAGILHDVVDDGGRKLSDVEEKFGTDVMKLVQGVSKLSNINQLLRRQRRTTAEQNSSPMGLSPEDVDSLRIMLLGMVNDPRVVLIKLADRLHNMRTIYALPHGKACALAQETLAVWCSLASRLGVWAVKAELEDLCFAVLQPKTFRSLRAELAALWTPCDDWRQQRRLKRSKRWALPEDHQRPKDPEDEEDITMQDLLEAVVPFDILLDRTRVSSELGLPKPRSGKKAKVVRDAEVALAGLNLCEEALDKELLITTPYVPGMEVMLSGRLKSLYSSYCKMQRKGVSIDQIYDARALRVVVGDGDGTLNELAVEGCYSLLNVVHRLWPPVGCEFDDYILNPKPSGYQSLHTVVMGPDGATLEVQIRTLGMHEYAEYGHAAHWLYKEGDTQDFTIQNPSPANVERTGVTGTESAAARTSTNSFFDVLIGQTSALSDVGKSLLGGGNRGEGQSSSSVKVLEGQSQASTVPGGPGGPIERREYYAGPGLDSEDVRTSGTFGVDDDSDEDLRNQEATTSGRTGGTSRENEAGDLDGLLPLLPATWPIAVGQPALRIEDGRLLAAVVVRVDNNGRDLLVAVSFSLHAREAVAAGRSSNQVQRWATYARLLQKVQARWWNGPGHGDWTTCLEHYTLCKDGIYHKEDQFGRALPTFIQLLELSPEEQEGYEEVGRMIEAGKDLESWAALEKEGEGAGEEEGLEDAVPSNAAQVNNKVRLLRSMLQWEQELRHEVATDGSVTTLHAAADGGEVTDVVRLSEVLIIRWPGGEIMRMPIGSEARDVARQIGEEDSNTVLVNNKIALPSTKLRDGDLVEIRS